MENNTINIDVATGEITHSYTEPQPQQPIVINYDEEVVRLIRQKYTADQEFAIHRQREEKPDEWLVYYNYCEACKEQVRQTD